MHVKPDTLEPTHGNMQVRTAVHILVNSAPRLCECYTSRRHPNDGFFLCLYPIVKHYVQWASKHGGIGMGYCLERLLDVWTPQTNRSHWAKVIRAKAPLLLLFPPKSLSTCISTSRNWRCQALVDGNTQKVLESLNKVSNNLNWFEECNLGKDTNCTHTSYQSSVLFVMGKLAQVDMCYFLRFTANWTPHRIESMVCCRLCQIYGSFCSLH